MKADPPDRSADGCHSYAMKNVIGILPGKKRGICRPERGSRRPLRSSRPGHIERARPGVRGKIHPGADDNASGVAVLLELARTMKETLNPDRSIVFVAFTGEEEGKLGSDYYVRNEKQYPVSKCIGMVNLDTVGRLEKRKLLVLGSGSAREWVHIFRGAGFVTGVDIEMVSQELDSSDQKSFQQAGVPAVQLFSGPTPDYHRPTDTADKIDARRTGESGFRDKRGGRVSCFPGRTADRNAQTGRSRASRTRNRSAKSDSGPSRITPTAAKG